MAAELRQSGTAGPRIREVLRFLAVGVCATLLNVTVYYLLLKAGVPYALAMPAGFVSGSVLGYVLNSIVTFQAARRTLADAARYICVNLVSLCVGEAVLVVLVEGLRQSLLPSSGLVILLTTCLNFIGVKRFVFRTR